MGLAIILGPLKGLYTQQASLDVVSVAASPKARSPFIKALRACSPLSSLVVHAAIDVRLYWYPLYKGFARLMHQALIGSPIDRGPINRMFTFRDLPSTP